MKKKGIFNHKKSIIQAPFLKKKSHGYLQTKEKLNQREGKILGTRYSEWEAGNLLLTPGNVATELNTVVKTEEMGCDGTKSWTKIPHNFNNKGKRGEERY